MDFRRNGHRDERRRRVLLEETGHRAATRLATADSQRVEGGRTGEELRGSYTEAALTPCHRQVADLIPTRLGTVAILLLLALTSATALQAGYGYLALGYSTLSLQHVPALDLAARGSIAAWFNAGLFLISAALGTVIYLIRRHRVDDYRGRYRMWCWVVPVLVLASLDAVADLQYSLRVLSLQLAGIPNYPDALLIWSASLAVLGATMGARLAVEMRACRLALLGLAVTSVGYAAGAAVAVDWLLRDGGVFRVMAASSVTMVGNVGLAFALSLYARHVYRDAHGLIPPKPLRVRSRRTPTQPSARPPDEVDPPQPAVPSGDAALQRLATGTQTKLRRDPAHQTVPRVDSPPKTERPDPAVVARKKKLLIEQRAAAGRAAEAAADRGGAEPEAEDGARKLSKAERRMLRKQRRQDHEEA